jgi:hypothetical protein
MLVNVKQAFIKKKEKKKKEKKIRYCLVPVLIDVFINLFWKQFDLFVVAFDS